MRKIWYFLILSIIICSTAMAEIDISNISNPNNWKSVTHQTTYTIGNDGKTLFYRGQSTGMTLNTPGQPGGKITVKDPSITPQPRPQPKPEPKNNITPKGAVTTVVQVAGGLVLGAEGVDITTSANEAGTQKKTWGDVGTSAVGTAMTVAGAAAVINAIPVGGQVAYGAAIAVGAAIGTLATGRKIFSETDCENDSVRGVYACCNISNMTNIQAYRAEIGQEMWTDVFPYVRTCLQGNKPYESDWFTARFLDDHWGSAEKRLCDGVAEPTDSAHVLGIGRDPDGDNKNICWDWTCENGWRKSGTVCVQADADKPDPVINPPADKKTCREQRTTTEGKACCDLPKEVAEWTGKECRCLVSGMKFVERNGRGYCEATQSDKTKPFECNTDTLNLVANWSTQCKDNADIMAQINKIQEMCRANTKSEQDFNKLWASLLELQPQNCTQTSNTDVTITITKQTNHVNDIYGRLVSIHNKFRDEKSVWKDKDGNFNTARLASDSIAGVVLGTTGALVTSHVVKKNQVENGFEDIKCTIGGQNVSQWGDQFRVGIQ